MRKPKTSAPSKETAQKHASPRARAQESGQIVARGMLDPAKEIMEKLARKYTPEGLMAELDELANAKVTYHTKDGRSFTKPDYATRLRSLELRFAYLIGKPIERVEKIIHSPRASLEGMMADAKRSPVFRKTLIDLLQNLTKDESRSAEISRSFNAPSAPMDFDPS